MMNWYLVTSPQVESTYEFIAQYDETTPIANENAPLS